jgi:V/A-type H+-transporting ATPase subunit C
MKSRLLSRRELEGLAEVESLPGLIAALTKTAYRKPVEAALARTTGLDCISEALHNDLIATLGKIRTFYSESAGEAVDLVLQDYDVHNVKAILRGLSRNAPSGEILSALLPAGELSYSLLMDLARAPGPRAAIDQMASMNLAFAQPLLRLRAERPGAGTFEMELALERWRFQEAQRTLDGIPEDGEWLSSALKLEADLANLLTVLRFAQTPEERQHLRERLGAADLSLLFVGPGFLPFELLGRAGKQDSLDAAVETLAGSVYGSILAAGLDAFKKTGRLSEFEMRLKRYRLRWLAGLIARCPLGIGVLLGYLALKTNEIGNIRWIAQGINLGLKPEAIRAGLELFE